MVNVLFPTLMVKKCLNKTAGEKMYTTPIRISPSGKVETFYFFSPQSWISPAHPEMTRSVLLLLFASSARTMCSSRHTQRRKNLTKEEQKKNIKFLLPFVEGCRRGQRQPWRRGRAECAANKKGKNGNEMRGLMSWSVERKNFKSCFFSPSENH